jgi:chromosome partitioning protein
MPVTKTIAIINQKGGVGKTTTTANLGAAIADLGRGVCLMDLDPQCHLSLHFGHDGESDSVNLFDVFAGEASFDDILEPVYDNLWLAPASIDLAAVEGQLATHPGREQIIADALAQSQCPAEFRIIDCPPSLGLLTLNALACSDEVIIPMQPQFLALQGLARLLQTVALVQQRINPQLKVKGVILCMFERITRLANEVVAELLGFFDSARDTGLPWSNARVFETVIRRNIRLAECPSHSQSIFQYDPTSNGAQDYLALAEEFLESYDVAPLQAEPITPAEPVEPEAIAQLVEQLAPTEPTETPDVAGPRQEPAEPA